MSTDLDARLRALVADAVSAAPPAPELDHDMVTADRPADAGGRRWPWVLGAVAAAAAVVVVAVVATRDEPGRLVSIPADSVVDTVVDTVEPAPADPVPIEEPWPGGVYAVVASEAGVTALFDSPVGVPVSQTVATAPAELAFWLADGSIVYQTGTDIRLLTSTGIDTLLAVGVLVDVRPDGNVAWEDGASLVLSPVSDFSVRVPADPADVQLTTSPSGVYRASIFDTGMLVVLGQGDRVQSVQIDDPEAVDSLDVGDDGVVVVNRTTGVATLVVPSDAGPTSYDVPVRGTVTLQVPAAEPPVALPPGEEVVAVARPDGVWLVEVGTGVFTQIIDEPMSRAIPASDGSIYLQRHTGFGEDWTQADTLPLVWRNDGLGVREASPGTNWAAIWFVLHDVATLNDTVTMLYQVARTPDPLGPDAGSLVVDATTDVVDSDFGGWERSSNQISMSDDGRIVGEIAFDVTRQWYSKATAGANPLTADELFLDDTSSECATCPRAFTIDPSGTHIAFIAGNVVTVRQIGASTSADRTFPFDSIAFDADLVLGDTGFVLNQPGRVPLLVRFGQAGSTPLGGVAGWGSIG